ncbi:hypothetical protein [Marixanthomonas spongiae]|uniref:Lipoprotein n=1 Tax=Marixanthomonas spongiae TaxID=2174845 RepID=A0A2U0HYK6_9FLAO|nr:hypothetical protein [Marixanthomonas spongiae]PVW13916.1 hypothetical protein DDV96_12260 [Marixanthomonas spongiae]
MKTINKTIYIAVVAFLTLMSGCSKDKNDPKEEENTSGAAHEYNITVDGQNFSGKIDNVYGTEGENGAISAVSVFYQDDTTTQVSFSLQNNDMIAVGGFVYPNGQGDNVSLDDEGNSSIEFKPSSDIGYASESGTAKVIIGKKVNLGEGVPKFAALEIEFEGTFSYLDENNDRQMVSASGTFIVNLPPGY